MSGAKIEQSLRNLELAVLRLREALDQPASNPLAIDGVIQRFEFVFELSWKTLKHLLEAEGISATTPRAAIRQAFKAQWINDEAAWLQMLSDRNETSHTYNADLASRIYAHIRDNFPIMAAACASFRERAGQWREEG